MSTAAAAQALVERVDKALGWHDVAWDTKESVLTGLYRSGGLGLITWDEVDKATQQLIEQVEALPQTGWDDPADVPDDVDEDDLD